MCATSHPSETSDTPAAENVSRVLLVGAGKAGGRFLRVMDHLEKAGLPIRVVGVCDQQESLARAAAASRPVFTEIAGALDTTKPDTVCVCVNEYAHHAVLIEAFSRPMVSRVLSEKPLTRTIEEFHDLERVRGDRMVTVNFVERHSPIVREFRDWVTAVDGRIVRVEFWWGKHRFRDSRPTMGVLSEISHPIDLVRCLLGQPADAALELLQATITESDFSPLCPSGADTAHVTYRCGGVPVIGSSSFLWVGRRRKIVCWVVTGEGTHQAVMDFDNPRWDEDSLTIWHLDGATGHRQEILERSYTIDDFPAELAQVNKVARFVVDSLTPRPDIAATMADAKWVQSALEEINSNAVHVRPRIEFGFIP
ncbi:Gfo/Idh/MocA family protein [Nocardia gipuzkoensis]